MPFLTSPEEASAYYTTHSRDISNIVSCLDSVLKEAKNPLTVLVVGCGNGQHDLKPLVEKLSSIDNNNHRHIVCAIDKSSAMINLLKENLKIFCDGKKLSFTEDGTCWSFGNIDVIPICMNIEDDVIKAIKNKINGNEVVFDLIILFSVLQHTTNWRQVLNTIIHLVKPGGNILVDEWFDSPLAMLDIAHKNPLWHYYFSLREKYTGIFWDPEVKAHDVLAVKNYFLGHGFISVLFAIPPASTSSTEELDLTENVKKAFGFGPLSWGKGNIFKRFVEEKLKNEASFNVPKRTIGFKVYCFQKLSQQITHTYEHAVTSANLITSTPVYETRIMNHFCVDINPSLLGNKTDIRQIQALQLGLQYSCFSARTHFAFPIQAAIHKDTGMITKQPVSVRTLLVPDTLEDVDILTRLITNMLVIRKLVDLGSVTAELLNIFQKQPQYSNYSFRLKVNNNSQLKVAKKVIDGVDLIECSFPCYTGLNSNYSDLRTQVKSIITDKMNDSIRYSFGEFKMVDLSVLIPDDDKVVNDIVVIQNEIEDYYRDILNKHNDLCEYRELLSLFGKLVPMMNDGEDLLLIFSPCQYIVDEQDVKIKSVSFGAFAILERQFEEPDSMFAFRLARLEFLNLVLQWERYNQMHELSHMRGEQLSAESERLKKHSQMLDLLQKPLRQLTEAHRQIQEDTQALRAILYDPIEGIFSVQNEIAELFKPENTILNPDSSRVVIEHEPSHYLPTDDEALWVLAHILGRFRGGKLEGQNAKDAFEFEINQLRISAGNHSDPFHEYAKSIVRLLDLDLAVDANLITFGDRIKKLERVKEILFTPFKPDCAADNMLWSILSTLLPSTVHLIDGEGPHSITSSSLIWVVSGANPFVTQGHLLTFVCRLVTQHIKKAEVTVVTVQFKFDNPVMNAIAPTTIDSAKKATVTFHSNITWINKNGAKELVTRLLKERDNKKNRVVELGEYGDFHLPFVTLVRRYPSNNLAEIDKEIKVTQNQDTLCLVFGKRLSITFDTFNFIIESSQEDLL